MLTCIACSKQLGGGGGGGRTAAAPVDADDDDAATPSTRQAIKALTSQIKDMAVKASGAYRHCKPCAGSGRGESYAESEAASGLERFRCAYKRAGGSAASTPRVRGSPPSMSGRTESPAEEEEEEAAEEEKEKEWVAQVEPGVLITFVSLVQGGNDLKRIRFSREMFNKWQAQRWWAENYDKVMELYNVRRFNRHAVPLPTPPRSEDESNQSSKMESAEDSPVTPPLSNERLPHNLHRPVGGMLRYSSSDSIEHHNGNGRHYYDSKVLASTPKLSSISGAKTERSSMDASVRTTSSSQEEEEEVDRSGELSASVSNASEQETEWVEQDEPGVYITIRALPGGIRELRRVRFSREKFGEMHARLWWEENRARIHGQYL